MIVFRWVLIILTIIMALILIRDLGVILVRIIKKKERIND